MAGFITISHETMFSKGACTLCTKNSEDDTVSNSCVPGTCTTVLTLGKGIAGTEAFNVCLNTALTESTSNSKKPCELEHESFTVPGKITINEAPTADPVKTFYPSAVGVIG